MEANTQQERARQLEQQAREYLMQSNDPIFTQYLQQLLPRIQKQPQYVEQLQAELDKSVEFWHRRQQINAVREGRSVPEDVRPQMTPPVTATQTVIAAQTVTAAQSGGEGASEIPQMPDSAVVSAEVASQRSASFSASPVQNESAAATSPVQNETVTPPIQNRTASIPVQNGNTPPAPARKKPSTEYVLATVALSVVGGIFILTALVLLGMYFMNGWVKGIALYAISLAVVALAELLIRRKQPKLAQIFSAIGVAALYLVTMINTLSLHIFGILPAAIIITLITVGTILLSRKRDSLIHRLLGIAACWLCAYPLTMSSGFGDVEILFILALILVMNLLCLCVPVRRGHTATHITQLVSVTIMLPVVNYWLLHTQKVLSLPLIVAYGAFFLIGDLVLILQTNYVQKESESGHAVNNSGLSLLYILFAFVAGLTVENGLNTLWDYGQNAINIDIYVVTGIALVVTIAAILGMRNAQGKWMPCWLFGLVAFCAVSLEENELLSLTLVTALLILVKVLNRFAKKELNGLDIALTTAYCILLLANEGEIPSAYVLLAGTVISMFLVYGWTTMQEILLTFSLAAYAAWNLMPMLKLPAFSGILFVSILLFNNVKWMRGESIRLFNVFVMVGQIGTLICLANPVYRNSYITYLCVFVFVLAYLVLTLQERYYKEFKHKNLIIVLFLTYMALIFKTNIPVINSILIMLIALVSVTLGFVKKDKPARIYGLVISLVTCGKIALYDYWGAPVLQKTILFFVVGVIALAIAGVYIVLEKKCNEQN